MNHPSVYYIDPEYEQSWIQGKIPIQQNLEEAHKYL